MAQPLDPFLADLLKVSAGPSSPPISTLPIEQVRATTKSELQSIDRPGPEMQSVTEHEIPVAGARIRARVYRPLATPRTEAPGLVYFHGGGWVQCDLDTHDSLCRKLAHASGAVLASIDYRLAPEHKFPVPLEDAVTATRWFVAESPRLGVAAHRVAVGGDSAGGNLAASVTQACRDLDLRFQLLLYPVTDLVGAHESRQLFGKGYWLDNMPFYTDAYLARVTDRLDPRASPLRATDHRGLPPAYIVTAGYDPLRDEGQAYAERLRAAGVRVESYCAESMIHGFLSLHPLLPAGDQALTACGEALRRGLAT